MKQIILSFCLLLCYGANAQNIYGRLTQRGGQTSYAVFNIPGASFSVTGNMANCAMGAATSNLTDKYYYTARRCHNAPTYSEFYLYTFDIHQPPTAVFVKNDFSILEYDDDVIWGIDVHSNSLQQVKPTDGHMEYYDDVFKDPSWNMYAPFIYCSAFNHDKKILYFTCANAADMHDVYFYQYDLAARTLTRQPLPDYTIMFDYSPLNDRAYFLCGSTPGQPNGIGEYNIATNTFTSVYSNSNLVVPWFTSLTIDPIRNRLYFQQYQDVLGQCTTNIQACYHINSRQMDTYGMSGWGCSLEYMEYMATDASDTTWDDAPLGVASATLRNTGIQVYPNPASDALHISCATAPGAPLYISDMMGRVVLRSQLKEDKAQVDVSTLANGQYILRIGNSSAMVNVVR